MTTTTRTYSVTPKATEANPAPQARLVVAANQSQALRHVAQDTYTVGVASGVTVGELMKAGTELEYASASE